MLSSLQDQFLKDCLWCIVVSTDPAVTGLSMPRNVSIVPPNSDNVRRTMLSALDLPLIAFLETIVKKPQNCIVKDVNAVLRRIERCSDFPEYASKQKSYAIPKEIKDVLERYFSFCL